MRIFAPSRFGEFSHAGAVINDEPEMPVVVRTLRSPFGQRDELIAHVDEGGVWAATPQCKRENASIEGQRLLDIPDLERDMIDTDQVRFCFSRPCCFLRMIDWFYCGESFLAYFTFTPFYSLSDGPELQLLMI